jgi:GGDEF domain-containing protein
VSRYGGEEFVVILFDCPENMAEQVAVRIQDGCAQQLSRTVPQK